MNFVVGINGKETVRALSGMLGIPSYERYTGRRDTKFWRVSGRKQLRGFVPELDDEPVTINWGNTMVCSRGVIVYNSPTAVSKASNKALARKIMSDAGVSVPRTFSRAYGGSIDLGEEIVKRPLRHRAGSGFEVVDGDVVFEDDYYYSELIHKVKEFRVHVGSGEVISVQDKVLREGLDVPTSEVWNHANGEFVFENVKWNEINLVVAKTAIDAVNALGLDYGAVDVILNEFGDAFTLEVNTSPSLTGYTLDRYSVYFKGLLESDEHYPFKNIDWDEVDRGSQIVIKGD